MDLQNIRNLETLLLKRSTMIEFLVLKTRKLEKGDKKQENQCSNLSQTFTGFFFQFLITTHCEHEQIKINQKTF